MRLKRNDWNAEMRTDGGQKSVDQASNSALTMSTAEKYSLDWFD